MNDVKVKYSCPQCAQIDRGFSKQWLVHQLINNQGNVEEGGENGSKLQDTEQLICEECGHQDAVQSFEVMYGESKNG